MEILIVFLILLIIVYGVSKHNLLVRAKKTNRTIKIKHRCIS